MQSPTPSRALLEGQLTSDPLIQFRLWFDEAIDAGIPDANAMTLATATPDGKPSARVVLLKSIDDRGFCFFTNYRSRKGRELDQNPNAALVFFWQPLHRQVRIEGTVERLTSEESDAYFHSRPLESQIGALVSPQSSVIPNREYLDERFSRLADEHKNGVIPRPGHWGGYRVIPFSIEFWQGRESRLHDRFVFHREGSNWRSERLAP